MSWDGDKWSLGMSCNGDGWSLSMSCDGDGWSLGINCGGGRWRLGSSSSSQKVLSPVAWGRVQGSTEGDFLGRSRRPKPKEQNLRLLAEGRSRSRRYKNRDFSLSFKSHVGYLFTQKCMIFYIREHLG